MPARGFQRTRHVLRRVEFFLSLIAFLVLSYSGFVVVRAKVRQAYESWRFDQTLQGEPASWEGFFKHWITSLSTSPSSAGAVPIPGARKKPGAVGRVPDPLSRSTISVGSLVGRIEIPRIGVSAMILEGDNDETLAQAVGHIPGTAFPNQPGNVVLAGHRDTFFRGLRNIRQNDTITLTTLGGEHRYSVQSAAVVNPSYTEALEPSGHATLTLVTCYPFNFVGHAPQRFIVRARARAADQPVSAQARFQAR